MKKRLFLLALTLLGSLANVMAQALDLSTVVNLPSTVTYTVENDATYPWTVVDGALQSTNKDHNSSSYVTLTLNCQEPVVVELDYYTSCEGNYDLLHIDVNGTDGTYSGNTSSGTRSYPLNAGANTIRIGYTKDGSGSSGSDVVKVSNIHVITLLAVTDENLARVINASPTVRCTVQANDGQNPWVIADGSLKSTNKERKTRSFMHLRVVCDNPVRMSYTEYTSCYSGLDYLWIAIDNYSYHASHTGNTTTGNYWIVIPAGEHTVSIGYVRGDVGAAGGNEVKVSGLRLTDMEHEAVAIDLSAPGTLGVEALSRVSTLPDMQYLRLTGTLNSADWNTISNMTGLLYINMEGTTVTDIPASAFQNTALRAIKWPAGLQTIGDKACYGRKLVGTLTFPATLTSIGASAFYQNLLRELVLPRGLTSIGSSAFYNSSRLKTVEYSTGMTEVPNQCFNNSDSLRSVTGLDNVTTLGSSAFSSCAYLESVGSIQPVTVGYSAFSGCCRLKAIDLSRTESIDSNGFQNCDSLKTVDFSSLTSIANYAFQYCDGLTTVTFNDDITSIPAVAFYNCSKLEEVHLGASVRSLGDGCFNTGNANIARVYVKAPTPPSVTSPFYNRQATLYVPEYAMVSYKLDDYWSQFGSVEVNPERTERMKLYGNLELTSNARIPDSPDVQLLWASSSAAGASFTINGDNPLQLGAFRQYVAHYKYSSSASPCTSTLISRCANMTSVSSEVRFWCDKANTYWYYLCMPFDVERSNIYCSNGASLAVRYYDGDERAANGSGGSWKDVPADGILEAGRGYIFCTSKADYVVLPAARQSRNKIFASTAISTPLEEYTSTTTADAGWNLVGNPYTSFYDIYYMDYTAPITVWSTTDKTFTAYSVADDELALYPMQAFFVQKPSGVDAITFQPVGRQRTLTIEHAAQAPARRAQAATHRSVVNMALGNGQTQDVTRVVVNAEASDDFEAETDAAKMMSYEGTAQLYTLRGDVQYAINEGAQADGTVQLGFWAPADGEYTLSLTRADCPVELYDNGVQVPMPYTFSAQGGTDDGRFTLAIGNPTAISSVPGASDAGTLFDLSGRRATNTRKGIYIINGKKVIR